MRRFAGALLVALVGLAGSGCAALRAEPEPDPEQHLAWGLTALENQDYQTAHAHLAWLVSYFWNQPVGQRAMLALAAAEMDPRNPGRRLGIGAQIASDYLRLEETAAWLRPVVESAYLMALELGAAEEEIAQLSQEREAAQAAARQARAQAQRAQQAARAAEAEARRARAAASAPAPAPAPARQVPALPGPPVTARVRELEQERSRLTQRATELERQVANRDAELERTRRELDRIRRTLQP
jgi:chemotaxis protein histidine kinase CheA